MKLCELFSTRSGFAAALGLSLLLSPAAALAQSDATLYYLFTSEGTLTPAFTSSTFSYTASVPGTTTSITVTPYATDYYATVTVNGSPVTYGSSAPISLSPGPTLITTKVVSADSTATNTYTLTVTREVPSSNAALASLVPSAGTLTPAFASNILSYTATVLYGTTSMTVTPTAADPGATITVNGIATGSGSPSSPISLSAGPNTITTVVTAPDSTTIQTYTLTVTPAATPVPLYWDAAATGTGPSDGAGTWDTGAYWSDGSTAWPWVSGFDAVLGNGGAGGAVTLGGATTVNSLTMNSFSGTYTLGTTKQTITLNNGITNNSGAGATTIVSPIILGAAQTWLNNSTNVLTVSGAVNNGANWLTIDGSGSNTISGVIGNGAGGLTKSGTGQITLTGANTYTGATTINGGTLTIGGAGKLGNGTYAGLIANNGAFVYNSSAAQTLSTNISGSGSLTVSGSGTLTLSASNSYTGGTFLSGGRVVASGNSNALSTGTITFNGSAQLQLFDAGNNGTAFSYPQDIVLNNGATASISGGGHYSLTGNVTGNGGITAATFSGSTVIWLKGTSNTFTGPIIIGPGSSGGWCNVQVASLADSPTANGMIQLASGSAYASSGRTDGFIWLGSTPLVLNYRQLVVASTTLQGGSFYNNSPNNSPITINTTVTGALGSFTNGPRILSLGGTATTDTNTLAGAIIDGTDVTLAPTVTAGKWVLSGTNSYTGATTLSAGTLIVNNLDNGGSPSALGQSGNAYTSLVLNGGTLQYAPAGGVGARAQSTDRNFALVGSASIDASGAGALSFTNAGALSPDVTGLGGQWVASSKVVSNLTGTAGLLVGMAVTGTGIAANSTVSSINSATQVTLNNNTTSAGSDAAFGYVARTLTLTGTNADLNTLAGILQDSAAANTALSLTKAGTGTWVLSGADTYSGATAVNGGTLLVNSPGSLGASSAVTVKTNATLGGNGTIGGSVTVNNGGNLSPGASVGMLSIGGNLDVSALAAGTTGKLYYELGPISGSDSIAVAGTLTIGSGVLGVSDFAFTNVGGLQAGTYTLMTSGGIVGSLNAADLTNTLGSFTGVLQTNGNNLELVVTASAPLTPPVLSGCGTLAGTSFPLTFSGPNGQTYKVLSSTNVALPLTNWTVLSSGTFPDSPVTYTNSSATNKQQFYRIQSP